MCCPGSRCRSIQCVLLLVGLRIVFSWPCVLSVEYIFCWLAVCIVDGFMCVLLLVGLRIVAGWPFVMLVGCVYYCWMAVCFVIGWLAYCCWLALCIVGSMCVFLFVVRVNCC